MLCLNERLSALIQACQKTICPIENLYQNPCEVSVLFKLLKLFINYYILFYKHQCYIELLATEKNRI